MDETNKTRVMVDIETLGKVPVSTIVSIGACVFHPDTDEISNKFYIDVDISSQYGRYIDPETLQWWLTKNIENSHVLVSEHAWHFEDAMEKFEEYLRGVEFTEIWANSPQFDLYILKNCLEHCDIDPPWKFWQERDFRTMKESYKGVINQLDFNNANAHDALEDAIHQARIMNTIIREINDN